MYLAGHRKSPSHPTPIDKNLRVSGWRPSLQRLHYWSSAAEDIIFCEEGRHKTKFRNDFGMDILDISPSFPWNTRKDEVTVLETLFSDIHLGVRMMYSVFRLVTLLALVPSLFALYGPKSDVLQVGADDFKKVVLQDSGVVMVEFYAPWCGHCKSLAPEWETAASQLKGVVKVVAVDATQHESLAQKYQIQGFPTIKVFGADKKAPVDYQGQRQSGAIVSEAMKAVNQLVKDRKSGKSKSEKSGEKKSGDGKKKDSNKKKSSVVELTEANFAALVLESNDHWMVEFYAPWCGHCKKLEPEWKKAADRLAPEGVKLGAVDATVHTGLAQKYGIKGFPTIKVFAAGPKTAGPTDYQGAREADAIIQYGLDSLERSGAPVPLTEITSTSVFQDSCGSGQGAKLCAILFLPHILDSGAKGRNEYLEMFQEIAKTFRKMPFAFIWAEANAQPALESALSINGNFPTVAVVSLEKSVYAVPKVSWSKKNIQAFLNGILSGRY